MATLPKRVVKLEEVVLGSVASGALVTRVQHLEVCCLGSAAAGPLPQRLDKLEEATGCTAGDGAAVAVDAAPAPEVDEVADAAASTQVDQPEIFALPAAKRRRCNELRQEGGYQLEANAGSVAPNPKAFKVHPLREEQLRSLAWMYSREACRDGFKGGMLADKMGYGKTATTIGMLSEKPGQEPDQRPSGYIRNPATLILCPPHLVEQWEGEFIKFLGDEVQLFRPSLLLAKQKKRLVLPPIRFTGSQLFTVHGQAVSGLSQEMRRHNAGLRLTPEKQLQEGDYIESLKVELPPGQTFVTEFCGTRTTSRTAFAAGKAYDFQHFLDQKCRQGCTVEVIVVRETKPRIKRFRGEGSFRILTIANNTDFGRLKLKDLLLPEPFNVVLVSTSILGANYHHERLTETLNNWLREEGQLCLGKSMGARQKMLRECIDKWHQKDGFLAAALRSSPALLETMWWNRMVLDEFHESESWVNRVRDVMKSLGATHRWGLSGTPPLDTTDAVLEVAELLWYATDATAPFMSEALKHRKSQKQSAKTWLAKAENKRKDECQAMIRDVVRQNSSQLVEAIRVQEHEEFVQFTAQERLIYQQACHDHDMFDEQLAYEGASVKTREALLKRCAHFCLETDAGDAGEAVVFLGRRKRAHIEQLQQQLELEASRAAHLSVWETAKHGLLAHKAQHTEAEKFIHEVYRTSEQVLKEKDPEKKCFEMQIDLYDQNGERRLRPEVRFKQPFRDAHVYPRLNFRHVVQHAVARKCVHREPHAERLLSQLQVCAQMPCRDPQHLPVAMSAGFQVLANLLDAAHRSLDFYTGQMRSLSDIESLRNEQCSVCLTPKDDLAALVMLPCSHIFHRDCVRSALETNPTCPYCRAHAPKKSMSSVLLEASLASCSYVSVRTI